MKFAGFKTRDEFYKWLNPDLPHDQVYNAERLLSEYVEVGKAVYWHFLEMLPPMYFSGSGFAICEATTGDIRLAFFHLRDRYFAAHIQDGAMTATKLHIMGDAANNLSGPLAL